MESSPPTGGSKGKNCPTGLSWVNLAAVFPLPLPDWACNSYDMEPSRIDESLSEDEPAKEKSYRRPLEIWRPLDRLDPAKRSRLFMAPTRAVYALWKRAQRW